MRQPVLTLSFAIIALGALFLSSCVRPFQNDGTSESDLEELAEFDPTAEATLVSESTSAPEPTEIGSQATEPASPEEEIDEETATPAPVEEATEPAVVPEEETSLAEAMVAISSPEEGALVDTSNVIVISGTGEGLPEGNIAVQIRDADGNLLAATATVLQGDNVGLGGFGIWEVSFTVAVEAGLPGSVYAFSPSSADGTILAEDTVNVSFNQTVTEPFVKITTPVSGTVLIDDSILVTGTGGGLFEGNVVLQAEDASGNVLLTQPTTLRGDNVGMGGSGDWETTLSVTVVPGTRGRIVAFSTSPADGSIVALDSVDVTFGEGSGPITHTVQAGENLYRISLLYGISMGEIMAANGITNPDYLYEGQELIIPIAAPPP